MKKRTFTVEIFTGTRYQLEVEASSKEEAEGIAEDMYDSADGDMEEIAGDGETDHETTVYDEE